MKDKKEKGEKLTINDVARDLGLSTTTISRAISGKGRISDETRNRVLEYIRIHNYRPNLIAKSLADKKTYNIGVVLPSDANLAETPFFQSCLMGICEAASSMDYDVVVTTTTENNIEYLKRVIDNHKVDGVILTRALINDLPAAYLKENNVPYVLIGTDDDDEVVKIDSDHFTGCSELTQYILMTGCSKTALIAGNQGHVVNRNRYLGYLDGCEKKGVVPHSEYICLDVINNIQVNNKVDMLIKEECDCIICTDDLICSRVLKRIDELKLEVPKDIKVASFYNSTFLENHNPPVTALTINVKELGIEAARTLIDMINDKSVKKVTLVDYEIVLKGSTKQEV